MAPTVFRGGMVMMFQTLLEERQRRPGSVERFFSTHPLTEDRIRYVRDQIRQLPDRTGLATTESGYAGAKQQAARY